ncbi:MAG: thermonuclease family protein [Synechococcus lacustris]
MVLSIADGDTVTVNEAGARLKVRLACIDAPELSQTPYGQASRQALQSLLPLGSQVTLRIKATDRYGRTVAELLTGKNNSNNSNQININQYNFNQNNISQNNINQQMIANGQAFVYWNFISACDRERYARLETLARLKGLGVWAVPGGLERPWELRSHSRQR